MFYCGLMKVEKLKKCNVSNAGIAHMRAKFGHDRSSSLAAYT